MDFNINLFAEDDINKLKHEIDLLTRENKALKDDYDRLKLKYSEKSSAYEKTLFELNAVNNSRWWKITKPLRFAFDIFKRVLGKGLRFIKRYARKLKRKFGPNEFRISKKRRSAEESRVFNRQTKFSILVPLYNTPKDLLKDMICSVMTQSYKNWELCLADGSDGEHKYVEEYCLALANNDSRIKYKHLEKNGGISENTNACIDMATGDYIALFDHDDMLHPSALYRYACVIEEQNADFIYCDEDKFYKANGQTFDHFYKPDFAIDNLRGNNYICHFTVFKASLLEKSGKFRKEFDGSQDHDLVLRLIEHAEKVVHIPEILYHWRVSAASVASDPYAKPYTIKAGINAVQEHLNRVGLPATVESSTVHPNIYRIRYEIKGEPLVSILIPNYNHVDDLSRCIDSILTRSTYKNYEIIIIENNSNTATFEYYETLKPFSNIRVAVYPPAEKFNYSAINNFGFKQAKGEHIILLNNDTEIISPSWIEEMLMFSQRQDVGAVGAMLYYPNDTIQHAGIVLGVLTLAGHAFKHFGKGFPGYFGNLAFQRDVTAVTAACTMIPRHVFEEINGLDESFEVAFNDVDMCMRIRQAGYTIVFTPYCELYHHESISRGDDDSPEKKARFRSEVLRFQSRWKDELEAGDPYYNKNLTLDREDYSVK